MSKRTARPAAAGAAMALGGTVLIIPASPASVASRDGVCDNGEFCYYYNSDNQGSISDFTGSVADYGTEQPSCYDFKGAGSGQGQCVKNQAASVWNRSTKTVRVYFNRNAAVDATWGTRMTRDGKILQAHYCATTTACGAWVNGDWMSQYGSRDKANAGQSYSTILRYYYSGIALS